MSQEEHACQTNKIESEEDESNGVRLQKVNHSSAAAKRSINSIPFFLCLFHRVYKKNAVCVFVPPIQIQQ